MADPREPVEGFRPYYVDGKLMVSISRAEGKRSSGCAVAVSRLVEFLTAQGLHIGTAHERAVDCVFVNSGDRRARSLDPWCVTHERSAICCARELARRAAKEGT